MIEGREYLFLSRRSNRRRPKRSTLKGEALTLAREQADRRNQYNWLNHRIDEIYKTIAKLEN
jgi:hypothetical protein